MHRCFDGLRYRECNECACLNAMVLTRSKEDIFELLEHVSSDTKNFYQRAQLISFGDNPFDEDIFLMEVAPGLADQFLSNPRFTAEIKSEDGNDDENPAFFCTENSTQRLLETETSDILLLIPGLKIPEKNSENYWLTEKSNVSDRIVTAIKSHYIEPTPVRAPSLYKLKQRFLPASFTGHIEDEDQDVEAFEKFSTFKDLQKSVPCSATELLSSLGRLNVFSWKGQCRMFQLDYLNNVRYFSTVPILSRFFSRFSIWLMSSHKTGCRMDFPIPKA